MIQQRLFRQIISGLVLLAFCFSSVIDPHYAHAQTVPGLPAVGTLLNTTSDFTPVIVRGLSVYADDPMKFDFIVDTGTNRNFTQDSIRTEADKLIKYFLTALTVPTKDQWVNLSPYENNRIIEEGFGSTEMGKDLLAQDYILKQLMASLSNPENQLGQAFWERVYEKAAAKYGSTDIPLDTFNKVWITPDKASVYEHGSHVFVMDKHLKVMLEEDYLAMQHNVIARSPKDDEAMTKSFRAKREIYTEISQPFRLRNDASRQIATPDKTGLAMTDTKKIIKEILLPELEREVNEGEHFAVLRQIYNAMILATWFKDRLKESILGQAYVDKKVVKGVDDVQRATIEQIYNQYLEAYKVGVYDLIKEDYDPLSQTIVPKKYFSGGFDTGMLQMNMTTGVSAIEYFSFEKDGILPGDVVGYPDGNFMEVEFVVESASLPSKSINAAMLANLQEKEKTSGFKKHWGEIAIISGFLGILFSQLQWQWMQNIFNRQQPPKTELTAEEIEKKRKQQDEFKGRAAFTDISPNEHIADFQDRFLETLRGLSVDSIKFTLAKSGLGGLKIYFPSNALEGRDTTVLDTVGLMSQEYGLDATFLHFLGQHTELQDDNGFTYYPLARFDKDKNPIKPAQEDLNKILDQIYNQFRMQKAARKKYGIKAERQPNQMGNEPGYAIFDSPERDAWYGGTPSAYINMTPEVYFEFVAQAIIRAHQADPDAVIYVGGSTLRLRKNAEGEVNKQDLRILKAMGRMFDILEKNDPSADKVIAVTDNMYVNWTTDALGSREKVSDLTVEALDTVLKLKLELIEKYLNQRSDPELIKEKGKERNIKLVLSEVGASETLGEDQPQYIANLWKAIQKIREEDKKAGREPRIIEADYHEMLAQFWKDLEIHWSESGMALARRRGNAIQFLRGFYALSKANKLLLDPQADISEEDMMLDSLEKSIANKSLDVLVRVGKALYQNITNIMEIYNRYSLPVAEWNTMANDAGKVSTKEYWSDNLIIQFKDGSATRIPRGELKNYLSRYEEIDHVMELAYVDKKLKEAFQYRMNGPREEDISVTELATGITYKYKNGKLISDLYQTSYEETNSLGVGKLPFISKSKILANFKKETGAEWLVIGIDEKGNLNREYYPQLVKLEDKDGSYADGLVFIGYRDRSHATRPVYVYKIHFLKENFPPELLAELLAKGLIVSVSDTEIRLNVGLAEIEASLNSTQFQKLVNALKNPRYAIYNRKGQLYSEDPAKFDRKAVYGFATRTSLHAYVPEDDPQDAPYFKDRLLIVTVLQDHEKRDLKLYVVDAVENLVLAEGDRTPENPDVFVFAFDIKSKIQDFRKTYYAQMTGPKELFQGYKLEQDERVLTTKDTATITLEQMVHELEKFPTYHIQTDGGPSNAVLIRHFLEQARRAIAIEKSRDPSKAGAYKFTREESNTKGGAKQIIYRLKDSKSAEAVLTVTSQQKEFADIVINIKFMNQNSLESYEFNALGPVFRVATDIQKTRNGIIVGREYQPNERLKKMTGPKISPKTFEEDPRVTLGKQGVEMDRDSLIRQDSVYQVERRILTPEDLNNIIDGKAVAGVSMGKRLLGQNDPQGRDAATESGSVSTFTYAGRNPAEILNLPWGASAGAVSVDPISGKIVRKIEFNRVDEDAFGKAHVLDITFINNDGLEINQPVQLWYYFEKGFVAEYYTRDGYKVYSRSGMPLFVNKIVDKKEYRYSFFRYFADSKTGELLLKEELYPEVAETSSAREGTLTLLTQNGEFVAKKITEVMFKGTNKEFVDVDPFGRDVTEKVYNSSVVSAFVRATGWGDQKWEQARALIAGAERDTVNFKEIKLKNIENNHPPYIDDERNFLSWAIYFFAFLVILWPVASKFGLRTYRKNNINAASHKNLKKLFADKASLVDANALADKMLLAKELRGPIIVPLNLPETPEERQAFLDFQFQGYGFTPNETAVLKKLHKAKNLPLVKGQKKKPAAIDAEKDTEKEEKFKKGFAEGKILFTDVDEDPRAWQRVAPIQFDSLMTVIASSATNKFPPAMVIQELLTRKLITQKDIENGYKLSLITKDVKADNYGVIWHWLKNNLLTLSQEHALGLLRRVDSREKALSLLKWLNLLETPEVRVLKTIFENNLVDFDQVIATAQGKTSFIFFVHSLVKDEIIGSIYEDVATQMGITFIDSPDYKGVVKKTDKESARMSVYYRTHRALFANPDLLKQFKRKNFDSTDNGKKDIEFNPYPFHGAMENKSIRETAFFTIQQMNSSQTGDVTMGIANLMVQFNVYVARIMDEAVKNGMAPADVKARIQNYSKVMKAIMISEKSRVDAINKRLPSDDVNSWPEGKPRRMKDVFYDDKVMLFFETLIFNKENLFERLSRTHRTDAQGPIKVGDTIFQANNEFELWQELRLLAEAPAAKAEFGKLLTEFAHIERDMLWARSPEAAAAEDLTDMLHTETKVGRFFARAFQITRVWGLLAASVTSMVLKFGFGISAPILFGISLPILPLAIGVVVAIGILAFMFSPAFRAVVVLYWHHAFKPLLNYEKFWGIDKKAWKGWKLPIAIFLGKILPLLILTAFAVSLGAFWGFGLETVLTKISMGAFFFAASGLFFLVPSILGKATNNRQKLFWGLTLLIAAGLNFGLMPHHLFIDIEHIGGKPTLGFFIGLYLWALTIIPTHLSVYHVMSSFRSSRLLQSKTWGNVKRGLTDIRSVMPVWQLAAWILLGAVVLAAPFLGLALPAVIATLTLNQWLTVGLGIMLATAFKRIVTNRSFWENLYAAFIKEAQDVEKWYGPVTFNGETMSEYFLRLVDLMQRRFLLSPEEAEQWRKALRGEAGAKFVYPKSDRAREVFYDAFQGIFARKPLPDVISLIESSGTHLHAFKERFTFTPSTMMFNGTFNYNSKTGKETNLLGYVARNHTEWGNLITVIKTKFPDIDPEFIKNFENLGTKKVGENSDPVDMLFFNPLVKDEQKLWISQQLTAFMNEMRPSNMAVADSMAQDYVEYHLLFAYQHGDFKYYEAVRNLSSRPDFKALNDVFEKVAAQGAPVDSRSPEGIFLARFSEYHELVKMKLRPVMHEMYVWQSNEFLANKTIVKFGDVESFKDQIDSVKVLLQEREAAGKMSAQQLKELTDRMDTIASRQSLADYTTRVNPSLFAPLVLNLNLIAKDLVKNKYVKHEPDKFFQERDKFVIEQSFIDLQSADDMKLRRDLEPYRHEIFNLIKILYANAQDKSKVNFELSLFESLGPNTLSLFKELQQQQFLSPADKGETRAEVLPAFSSNVANPQQMNLSLDYQPFAQQIFDIMQKRLNAPDVYRWTDIFMQEEKAQPFEVIEVLQHLKKQLGAQSNGIIATWGFVEHVAYYLDTMKKYDIMMALYDSKKDFTFPLKHPGIATNNYLLPEITRMLDAQTQTEWGQHIHRASGVTKMAHNPHIATVSPTMNISTSTGEAWPVTKDYAGSQKTWTGTVQRGRGEGDNEEGFLSFYGKGDIRTRLGLNNYLHPAEDSSGIFNVQATQPLYIGIHTDWHGMRWVRMALRLWATEMRYAFNGVRLLFNPHQFAVMYNPNMGYDKKLSHMALFWHYLIAINVLLLLMTFPPLVAFSPFAGLTPYLFWAVGGSFLMQAINISLVTFHLQRVGNFVVALLKTLIEIHSRFPMYVTLNGNWVVAKLLAANEIFQFHSSYKNELLEVPEANPQDDFTQLMSTTQGSMIMEGFPLKGFAGITSIAGIIVGLFTLSVYGSILLIYYFYAGLVQITGIDIYGLFFDRKDKAYGKKMGRLVGALPLRVGQTSQSIGRLLDRVVIRDFSIQLLGKDIRFSPYYLGLWLRSNINLGGAWKWMHFTAVVAFFAANIFGFMFSNWRSEYILMGDLFMFYFLWPLMAGLTTWLINANGKIVSVDVSYAKELLKEYHSSRDFIELNMKKASRTEKEQYIALRKYKLEINQRRRTEKFANAITDLNKVQPLLESQIEALENKYKPKPKSDLAMMETTDLSNNLGGITMDSDLLKLEHKGAGMTPVIQNIPAAPLKLESLHHIIIKITPITTAQLLSRLNEGAGQSPWEQNAPDMDSNSIVLGKNDI